MGCVRVGLTGVLAAALLAPAAASGAVGPTGMTSPAGRVAGPDRVMVVTFDDRPTTAAVRARLRGLGVVVPIVPAAGVWGIRHAGPASIRRTALSRRHVLHAEWSLVRSIFALTDPPPPIPQTLPLTVLPEPSDPQYADPASSWHLRTGTWSIGLSARPRPVIAVLDSGLALTHEEWRTPGLVIAPHTVFPARSSVDDIERSGHGTHVSGIAAAPADGVGVVGVAPAGAGAPLMPVQIVDRNGLTTDAAMMAGVRWAVEHGAKVINISAGGPGALAAFQTVVNWAYGHGVLIVAAVGNNGTQTRPGGRTAVEFPAGYDHVLGVGAQCDGTLSKRFSCSVPFGRAGFSNVNGSVDVLAPGVNIVSTIAMRVTDEMIAPGYGRLSGTSMAAPYVTGTAALVMASHPGASPFQVIRMIEQTATRGAAGLNRNAAEGWGVANPLAAAQAVAPPDDLGEPNDDSTPAVKAQTLSLGPEPVTLRAWSDAHDDRLDVYAVSLQRGDRLRVALTADRGRLRHYVFAPGLRSIVNAPFELLAAKELGRAPDTTPGTRVVTIRARSAGRHWVVVNAEVGGGPYTLTLARGAGS